MLSQDPSPLPDCVEMTHAVPSAFSHLRSHSFRFAHAQHTPLLRLYSQQRIIISTHHSTTSQAEMDNNLFHFDFDNDHHHDDINTDHNPATTTNTTTTMPGSGHGRKKLIARPNRNDVLCGRGGAVNSHPGNVAFRRLVHKHRTTYFASSTRKLDKARIAKEIIAQVHALPGRFLKQDGKTGKWLEINEQKAKKKVGQAFRDITPHDERSRIGAGLFGEGGDGKSVDAERSSDDDDEGDDYTYEYDQDGNGDEEGQAVAAAAAAAGYYPQDDVTTTASHMVSIASTSAVTHKPTSVGGRKRQHSFDDDDLHSDGKESLTASDRPSTPPLPPLPAPQPPSSLRHGGTSGHHDEQQPRHGLPPAARVVGFRPITVQRANSSQEDTALSRVDMSDMVATYNAHMQQQQQQQPPSLPPPPSHYSRHSSHVSNAEPSVGFSHHGNTMMKLQHKASRLPASEFALYPEAKSAGDEDDVNNDAGVAMAGATTTCTATLTTGTGSTTDGQQSRRGSTESTELEKLTMELLVKRARTWEELYYSEREYSRNLEDRLVGLLGDRVARQQMPKRRRVGDSDALAA